MASVSERAERAETIQRERRMKPGTVEASGLRLHVPAEAKDPAYEYRWVNDKEGRPQRLYDQDYDFVGDPGKEVADSAEGSVPRKIVGSDGGHPVSAVLMRKRKDWYRQDQKARSAVLDEIEAQIRGGTHHEKDQPALRGPGTYTPGGVNIIEPSR